MKKPTTKQWVIIAISLFLMFFGQYVIPPFLGFTQQGVAVLCIFFSSMLLYCTVDIMWPTFAAIAALITNGLFTYSQAVQMSFGNWIAQYVFTVTLLTYALRKSGFVTRAAIAMVSNKIARKSPKHFVAMFYLATLCLGLFIDPMTNFMVMSAILVESYRLCDIKPGNKDAALVLIGMHVIDSISSAATPFAHTNATLLTQMLTNDYAMDWSVLNFCIYGLICGLILLVIYLAFLFAIQKVDLSAYEKLNPEELKKSLKPFSSRELGVVLVYVFCIILWIAPGLSGYLFPFAKAFLSKLGLIFPCFVGLVLLALLRDKSGEPFLDIADGLKNGAAWPAVILTAGCMMLGSVLNTSDFGVVSNLTALLGGFFGSMNSYVLIFVIMLFSIIMTNFASNTVTQLLVYAVTVPMIINGTITGVNVMAYCAVMGMAVNFAFLTPTASGSATLMASHEYMTGSWMFKYSLPACIIGIPFCTFIAYPVACMFLK